MQRRKVVYGYVLDRHKHVFCWVGLEVDITYSGGFESPTYCWIARACVHGGCLICNGTNLRCRFIIRIIVVVVVVNCGAAVI
jgi:hypothetical protein